MLGHLLEKCGIAILISVVSFAVGVSFGLLKRADINGVYMSLSYPAGGELFKLGNPSLKMEDIDFNDQGQTAILLTRLENHPPNGGFSDRIRKLALDSKGPFEHINVTINIHLMDNAGFPGTDAEACKNSRLFKNPILVYEFVSSDGIPHSMLQDGRLLGFNVMWEHVSDCDLNEGDTLEIWANKDEVKSWIKADNLDDSSLMVKARMIVSSL